MTSALFVVLQKLRAHDPRYGLELIKETGLASGTVYPLLARMEDAELVVSAWDDSETRGPRRRLYSLTPLGVQEAQCAETSLTPAARGLVGLLAR